MKRVTDIGGMFVKAESVPALNAWYKRQLGIDLNELGDTAFERTDDEGKPTAGQ
jgi:hypothetical protein